MDSRDRFVEMIVDFLCNSLSLMQEKNCAAIKAFVYSLPRSSMIRRSQLKIKSFIFLASTSLRSNFDWESELKSCGAEKYRTENSLSMISRAMHVER